MTNPPPPGNWGPPQPPHGQGQPPYGPGQWPPQQPGWGQPPAPPKSNLKWLLIGVAVLLVIAISVGATLLFTRDSGGTTQTATGSPPAAGEIASANDTGPVTIITEDPTCAAWRPIARTLANVQASGWNDRDESIPEAGWSPELRQQYEAVASAMRQAADQTVPLTIKTPHRVMRELYEQSIAYWRAYANAVDDYAPADNHLSNAAGNASSAIVSICAAISSDAALARQGSLPSPSQPSSVSSASYPDSPTPFITELPSNSVCVEWTTLVNTFDDSTVDWRAIDPRTPATQWTPTERSTIEVTGTKIDQFADDLVALSETANNAVWTSFAELAAQYWRAYVSSIPTYSISDHDLSVAAAYLSYIPSQACQALEG